MSKIRLIQLGWTDFSSSYLQLLLGQYFTLEHYNLTAIYDKSNCVFVLTRPEYLNDEFKTKYLLNGFKLIVANMWEARPFLKWQEFGSLPNVLLILGCGNSNNKHWINVLNVPNWFWYNESLWYTTDNRFQYNTYQPKRNNSKLFLMPIKRSKKFRDSIVQRLDEFLDQSIYSYVEQFNNNVNLPRYTISLVEQIAPDRIFEPQWYNDTFFSVVVESNVNIQDPAAEETSVLLNETVPCEIFVTEKTFKPIAFQHPFIICGMQGVLKFLKGNGFETYDHIFDESYDTEELFEKRLDIIYNNIKQFSIEKYLDPVTEQKIEYNANRFYNRDLVLAGINTDLLDPLLEWINA